MIRRCLAVLLIAAPAIARVLLGGPAHVLALRIVLLNTLLIGFTFLPFHVLRIERRAVTFSLLTLARSTLTIALRLVLVIVFGMSVLGIAREAATAYNKPLNAAAQR